MNQKEREKRGDGIYSICINVRSFYLIIIIIYGYQQQNN